MVAGQPLRARAVLTRNGSAVANEVVQFGIEQPADLVKIDPSTGSLLTDASGTATATVSSLGASTGAGRIIVQSSVSGLNATASANFFASGSTTTAPPSLTLSAVTIGSTSVSAYGTTGLRVQVLQNNAPYTAGPVTVNFTSSCASGKATVTASATTQPNGEAVATFVDNGCAQAADTLVNLTASIATDSKTASMTVRAPTTGSLRFVSVQPADKSITLRGQGGNGRQENATVTFQLVDVAGQGVGNIDVCFDSSTYVGGLNVDGFGPTNLPAQPGATALCGTDALSVVRYVKRTNADGTLAVQVNSGTVPTPVRLRARALYPASATVPLESFSDTLSVSTGLPLQRSFSLSVDRANIDGGNFDGAQALLTVRLADQFSNPVPDGTVVNFIASGGAVCTADNGSCKTANGSCSCSFVSQARRPLDRRVVVTAYAVGLEDYDDNNGDNVYSQGVDGFAGLGYDLGDAYVDANKDGAPSSATINADTDILVPYQSPAAFTAAGNGTRGTAHIRASTIIYLSQSSSLGAPTAVVPLADLQQQYTNVISNSVAAGNFLRLPPGCPDGTPVPQASLSFYLDDGIGNPMAAGTGVAVVDGSDNIAPGVPRPAAVLAIGARPPSPAIDGNNVPKISTWTSTAHNGTVPSAHSLTIRGVTDKCSGNGSFAIQVTSPLGGPAGAQVLLEGQARGTGRQSVSVRYVDAGVSITGFPRGNGTLALDISSIGFVGAVGGVATSYTINWGDGQSETFAPDAAASTRSHVYATAGTKTVTVNVTVGGVVSSRSQSFSVN
ncbi:MAG: hypothetical protein C0505_08565 [Leptothrix sp. (in: Bacteria)]|nr:hypothetical protein [Leptothrix sp. (in: b-proteobacteria)]